MIHQPEPEEDLSNHEYQAGLAKQLAHQFDIKGLQNLCFQMEIDHENLPGETKIALAREMVKYCFRHGRLAELEEVSAQATAGRRNWLTLYRQQVLKDTQFLELKGIPLPLGRDGQPRFPQLPLDEIYIRLQAIAKKAKERQERKEEQEITDKTEKESRNFGRKDEPLNDFLQPVQQLGEYLFNRGRVYKTEERPHPIDPQKALQEHQRLVVLGAPGAGKSTMLQYLARRAAEDNDGPVPILVILRDFATARTQMPLLSLRQFALEQTAAGNTALQEALLQVIETERVLWLLDGLDETRDVAGETARQASQLPGQMLLTSRPVGYVDSGLKFLPHFEILPLDLETIADFLCNWMKLIAKEQTVSLKEANERLKHLEDQLNKKPQLQALTQNPLMLTFLVTLVGRDIKPELPDHRAELYARYIAELMNWEISRQIKESAKINWELGPLQGELAQLAAFNGFHYLGWILHLHYHGGKGQIVPDKPLLIEELTKYFINDKYSEAKNLAVAVFDFWQVAGLLDVWQIGSQTYLAFRHLTFQEYAAAWGLNRAFQKNKRKAWQFLFPRLHHYAWREPILLCTSLMDSSELNYLVRQLLRGKSLDERHLHRDLRLAKALDIEKPLNNRMSQKTNRRLNWLSQSHKWTNAILLLFVNLSIPAVFYLLTDNIVWAMYVWIFWFIGLINIDNKIYPYGANINLKSWIIPHISHRSVLDDLEDNSSANIHYIFGRLAVSEVIDNGESDSESTEKVKETWDTATVLGLCAELSHWEDFYSNGAKYTLREMGSDVVPFLISTLNDTSNNVDVRCDVIQGLGVIGDSTAIPHLITILSESNSELRGTAAMALGNIRDKEATASLVCALADNDDWVRNRAVFSLGQIGDPIAFPHLINVLSDPTLKISAIMSLANFNDIRAVPYLIKVLDEPDSGETTISITAFALGQIGDIRAAPHLISVLANSRKRVDSFVVKALARLPDPNAVSHLIAVLDNDDPNVRAYAAEALGNIGNVTAVPHLITTLMDIDKMVQQSTCIALGQIGQVDVIPHLLTLIQHKDGDIRNSARDALKRMQSVEAVPYFIKSLADDDEYIRAYAAKALGDIGDFQAVPYLFDVKFGYFAEPEYQAKESLTQISETTPIYNLGEALSDDNYKVRRYAVEALVRRGDLTVTPYLISALADSDKFIRKHAAIALGRIGDTTAIPYLITALIDQDTSVRYFSAQALGKIAINSNDLKTLYTLRRRLLWQLNDHHSAYLEENDKSNDKEEVSVSAFFALEQVVAQITKLQVTDLPLSDPMMNPKNWLFTNFGAKNKHCG